MAAKTAPNGRPGRRSRRGTVYVIVLGTTLIVSVLGLSALWVQRIHRQAYQGTSDAVGARLYAQAALRIGMLRIEDDPDWRHGYSHGVWEADVPFSDGTYTLEGIDPSDGDLADNAEDPLVMIGTGKQGVAVQKMQVTLAPQNRGYSCLEVAMHGKKKVKFDGATAYCDQTVSSNDRIEADSAMVNADVEGVNDITGSTYLRTTKVGIDPRDLPDKDDVFDYYKTNGTWIDIGDLPQGFSNVLRNPGIESGLIPWQAWEYSPGNPSCVVAQDTSEFHNGAASLKVTNRGSFQAGPAQDIAGIIQSGVTYDCMAWVKMTVSDAKVVFVINVTSSGEGAQYWVSSDKDVKVEDGWVQVGKTLTPTFSGTVSAATLKIGSKLGDPVNDFYVDDVVFKEAGSDRTIYRQVLSPSSNPFGGQTNPLGIYVIDCGDGKLVVKNSRIVGTLVLVEPKTDSLIGGGPLSWEPAVAGYPALMVEGKDVTIQPTTAGLVESANSVNFNPPGTPHDATGEDNDIDDTYPSQIKGLIYGTHKVIFRNHPVVKGAVVGNDEILIYDQFDLIHNPLYLRNPPPGFNGPEEIRILLDSAKRLVD